MENKHILLCNLDKLHTTALGRERIVRNLQLNANMSDVEIVDYCKNKILKQNRRICRRGKNWYCEAENVRITVNSSSYTIITAHGLESEF